MNRSIGTLLATALVVATFLGCSSKNSAAEQNTAAVKQAEAIKEASREEVQKALLEQKRGYMNDEEEKSFVVYGEGIAPQHTISPAQAIALAKRAAITDGYRQLGEKLYGAKINATETVKDAALKDSRIVSSVKGVVKDAAVTDTMFKDGLYTVRMELSMSARRWHELFAY